jgi:hypothetical protein
MDGQRFDSLARKLAGRADRRSVLRSLIGGGAALAAMKTGSVLAAPADKVTICHWSEDLGYYEQISVSTNAVKAHKAHQHGLDIISPDFTSDQTCGDCNSVCDDFPNSFCNEGVCDCSPYVCAPEECGWVASGCGYDVDCGSCVTEYPLFNCGEGFVCPTGNTTFAWDGPLDPTSSAQAKAACESCYGVGACYEEFADCAGPGWGPNPPGQYVCGNAYFGYTFGCSGGDGRSWGICNSYTTYGYWGLDECPAALRVAGSTDDDQPNTIVP